MTENGALPLLGAPPAVPLIEGFSRAEFAPSGVGSAEFAPQGAAPQGADSAGFAPGAGSGEFPPSRAGSAGFAPQGAGSVGFAPARADSGRLSSYSSSEAERNALGPRRDPELNPRALEEDSDIHMMSEYEPRAEARLWTAYQDNMQAQ